MAAERIIMHLDMDAFFASVEQAANPNWKGRPVVICGDGRSVVTTASYEARKAGVKAGMPAGQAKKLLPDGVFMPGNHPKYLWFSLCIINILKDFTPLVEPYSIDEAFADLSGHPEAAMDPVPVARRIKQAIREKLGLTCSIGIASSKLIAKIASDRQKPDGLTVVPREGELAWLHALPAGCLPGLGKKTEAFFEKRNIRTVGELARFEESTLVQWFGKNGSAIYRMAHGVDDAQVTPEMPALKSIGQEWTLPYDTDEQEYIDEALGWLSRLVGRRLRGEKRAGRTVSVKIRYPDFRTITRAVTLKRVLCLDEEIYIIARKVFYSNWAGEKVRLLGIKIANLEESHLDHGQATLWPDQRKGRIDLVKTVDHLKDKYGEDILLRAADLSLRKRNAAIRRPD